MENKQKSPQLLAGSNSGALKTGPTDRLTDQCYTIGRPAECFSSSSCGCSYKMSSSKPSVLHHQGFVSRQSCQPDRKWDLFQLSNKSRGQPLYFLWRSCWRCPVSTRAGFSYTSQCLSLTVSDTDVNDLLSLSITYLYVCVFCQITSHL